MKKGEDVQHNLLICCSVLHPKSCTARRSHSFTIIHMPKYNSRENLRKQSKSRHRKRDSEEQNEESAGRL